MIEQRKSKLAIVRKLAKKARNLPFYVNSQYQLPNRPIKNIKTNYSKLLEEEQRNREPFSNTFFLIENENQKFTHSIPFMEYGILFVKNSYGAIFAVGFFIDQNTIFTSAKNIYFGKSQQQIYQILFYPYKKQNKIKLYQVQKIYVPIKFTNNFNNQNAQFYDFALIKIRAQNSNPRTQYSLCNGNVIACQTVLKVVQKNQIHKVQKNQIQYKFNGKVSGLNRDYLYENIYDKAIKGSIMKQICQVVTITVRKKLKQCNDQSQVFDKKSIFLNGLRMIICKLSMISYIQSQDFRKQRDRNCVIKREIIDQKLFLSGKSTFALLIQVSTKGIIEELNVSNMADSDLMIQSQKIGQQAFYLNQNCDYNRSLNKHIQLLQIYEEMLKRIPALVLIEELTRKVISQILCLIHKSKIKNSKQLAQKYFAKAMIAYQNKGPDIILSQILNNMGTYYFQIGQQKQALQLYQRSLDIKRLHKDKRIFTPLNNIGVIHKNQGEYKQALEAYQQALKVLQNTNQNRTKQYAATLGNVAFVYSRIEQYETALDFSKRHVDLIAKICRQNDPLIGKSLLNIGSIHLRMEKLDEARSEFQQAYQILKPHDYYHKQTAMALNNLGHTYQRLGQYQNAYKYFKNTLEFKQQIYRQNHILAASSLYSVGVILKCLNRPDQSLPFFEKSCKIYKANYGADNQKVGHIYTQMGEIFFEKGQKSKAMKYYKDSLKILSKYVDMNKRSQFLANLAIAKAKIQNNELKQALKCYQKLLKIDSEKQGVETCKILFDIGSLYEKKGAQFYKNALQFLLKSVQILKKHLQKLNKTVIATPPVYLINKILLQYLKLKKQDISLQQQKLILKSVQYVSQSKDIQEQLKIAFQQHFMGTEEISVYYKDQQGEYQCFSSVQFSFDQIMHILQEQVEQIQSEIQSKQQ